MPPRGARGLAAGRPALSARPVVVAPACAYAACLGLAIAGPPALSTPAPRAVFAATSRSLTGIEGGRAAEFSFSVANRGSADLRLLEVTPSCGCTIASFVPVIRPGSEGFVRASVSTEPTWRSFSKELTVRTNDPKLPVIHLLLEGTVTPAVMVLPNESVGIEYGGATPVSQVFTVRFLHKRKPHLLGSGGISGPATVRIGQEDPGSGEYQVTLTVYPVAGAGDVTGRAVLPTDDPRIGAISLTLLAVSTDSLTAAPATVAFGTIPRDQPGPRRAVALDARQPFRIVRIANDDPHLRVELARVDGANVYSVYLTYLGGWSPGPHSGLITVYTDMGTGAPHEIHYDAQVR